MWFQLFSTTKQLQTSEVLTAEQDKKFERRMGIVKETWFRMIDRKAPYAISKHLCRAGKGFFLMYHFTTSIESSALTVGCLFYFIILRPCETSILFSWCWTKRKRRQRLAFSQPEVSPNPPVNILLIWCPSETSQKPYLLFPHFLTVHHLLFKIPILHRNKNVLLLASTLLVSKTVKVSLIILCFVCL